MRSRAAASTLQNTGFDKVYSLDGGMKAWDGKAAEGLPEADMAPFRDLERPEEQIALAWVLEEGTRRFYRQAAELFSQELDSGIFRDLASEEEKHKEMLVSLYEKRAGAKAGTQFPENALGQVPEGLMEGGMRVGDALDWARGKTFREALELAISVEVNAYDRYLLLQRELPTKHARDDFQRIAEQERRHLKKLSGLLNDTLA